MEKECESENNFCIKYPENDNFLIIKIIFIVCLISVFGYMALYNISICYFGNV
jgi:hypothetical protein